VEELSAPFPQLSVAEMGRSVFLKNKAEILKKLKVSL
jgi:hypothetical protein